MERDVKDQMIRKLQLENKSLRSENERLRSLLQASQAIYDTEVVESTVKERQLKRLELYRAYFRGRTDVYAQRWFNKQGKKQYSPVSQRRYMKWNDAKHRYIVSAPTGISPYEPLTDEVLVRHLFTKEDNNGEDNSFGLYIIVNDDECYFAVIDFDGDSWQKDVMQSIQVIDLYGFPYLIERSQSGKGAHIWFFFCNAIKAKKARQFCSSLITLSMEKQAFLPMRTYDRIFPSQDCITKNGLGSLIALPLEGESRKQGNTIFLDKDLNPILNPWIAIQKTRKIDEEQITSFLNNIGPAFNTGQVGFNGPGELPSLESLPRLQENALSGTVTLLLESGIKIDTFGLPSPLVNTLKRIASFHNPEFYKAERMRLSTWDKPRIICCAELIENRYINLPRGCLDAVQQALLQAGLRIEIEDRREHGTPILFNFSATLQNPQREALQAMLREERGILSAPPGFGKTVVASNLIAKHGCNVLVIVHTKPLLNQWKDRLSQFLSVRPGLLGGGKNTLTGVVDIALVNSLSQEQNMKILNSYGMVIVDECHHVAAVTYEKVLKSVRATYVYGLTATPIRNDGHHDIIFMQCGPILYQVDQASWAKQNKLSGIISARFSPFRCDFQHLEIQELYERLAQDKDRNRLIASDILTQLGQGRSILVLSNRLEQLKLLGSLLENQGNSVLVMTGSQSAKTKKQVQSYLELMTRKKKQALILSTGKYIGEGFDLPQLDTLVLASPIAWKGNVIQYVGRLCRFYEGKVEVVVLDYIDFRIPVLARMFNKRVNAYKQLGFSITQCGQKPKTQLIYTVDTYWEMLLKDIETANGEIFFSIPFLSDEKLQAMIPLLIRVAQRIRICMRIMKSSNEKTIHRLKQIGITVQLSEVEVVNYLLIDERILWYGSIHLFGKIYQGNTMLRLEDPTYAADFRVYDEATKNPSLF
ncbi:TOTE conflict system archaeo-eukaryotic primase domain-containing protein [Sphaerochaeta halotolerans]|nr:DEAD/DEAH box helicase family protein [Sphaerochaeta halotolerans]